MRFKRSWGWEGVEVLVSFRVYFGGEAFLILFVVVCISPCEGVGNFVGKIVFTEGVFVWCVDHES